MAAIKAAQLGLNFTLKVRSAFYLLNPWTRSSLNCMYREAWNSRGNVLKCWLHSLRRGCTGKQCGVMEVRGMDGSYCLSFAMPPLIQRMDVQVNGV